MAISARTERAWSFSHLKDFELCPHKWAETKLYKNVAEQENFATKDGHYFHERAKEFFDFGRELPMEHKHHEPFMVGLKGAFPTILTEQRMAINKSKGPVDFFARDVWCRSVADLLAKRDRTLFLLDWKTGKRRPDWDQIDIMTATTISYFDDVDVIQAGFYWVKEPAGERVEVKKYTRAQAIAVWDQLNPRVDNFQQAVRDKAFPARPNFLCANYCPVETCKHHGQKA